VIGVAGAGDAAGDAAGEALAAAQREFREKDVRAGSFEEDLFALVAAGLRKLKSMRKHLPVLLETMLSPLSAAPVNGDNSLRIEHLAAVAQLAKKHGLELNALALQLYWTLYTGLLMYWAKDRSAKQENTLALLDESLAMFVGWLDSEGAGKPKGGVEPCPQP